MDHKQLGAIILVAAVGILLISIARSLVWHADIALWIVMGCLFLVIGVAVQRGTFDRGSQ